MKSSEENYDKTIIKSELVFTQKQLRHTFPCHHSDQRLHCAGR